MKNLLVVAFHYPPDNTSTGVLRTAKFTEYLPGQGWRSQVISVPESVYASVDPNWVGHTSRDIQVERVWACDVKQTFGIRGFYPKWISYPDRYWPWFFAARKAGVAAIGNRGIQAVYTTYPMPTAHLVGWALKRASGLPWVADFRDPWAIRSGAPALDWLDARLEGMVVAAADRVICNTPAMRRNFLSRYPALAQDKFVTITNGYDEPDFVGLVPTAQEKYEILYPGGIDGQFRNPRPLLEAIALAINQGKLDKNDLQITFLGSENYGVSREFQNDLAHFELATVTQVIPQRIPYKESLGRMAGAGLLVVMTDHRQRTEEMDWPSMQVPAKLYEYLRLGRPILPLVRQGAVAELLNDVGGVAPVSPGDIEAVASRIGESYRTRTVAPGAGNAIVPEVIRRYSRENLTAMLARELDALVQ